MKELGIKSKISLYLATKYYGKNHREGKENMISFIMIQLK